MQAYWEFGSEGQYRLTAWGKNLTDELYFNNRFIFDDNGDGFADYHTAWLSDPRTFGLTFQANF